MRGGAPLVPFLLLTACSLFGVGHRSEPQRVSDRAEDPRSEAKLRKRFPGARSVELVKLVRWAERTPGPCTADFAADESANRIDLRYRTEDGEAELRDASLAELAGEGWLPSYRTPIGVGVEKIATFSEIDLTAHQTLVCQCFDRGRENATYPAVLRLRWSEGEVPAVSASVAREGEAEGLRPAVTAGRLVTYEFPITAEFPGGRPGTCAGHLQLTILLDRPLL